MFKSSFIIIVLLSCASCSDRAPQSAGQTEDVGAPLPPHAQAQGWTELKITSGYAETKLDIAGHFAISRNACFVGGGGAASLEVWNTVAAGANTVLAQPSSEICVARGTTPRALDGYIEFKLDGGAYRTIVESKGAQICGPFKSAEAARAFVDGVDQLLLQAFTEDCTIRP